MVEQQKKGRSVGLGKVIGLFAVALLIGMALGGYLGLAVIGPELQKLHFSFGGNDQNQINDGNNNGNQGQINNNNPTPSNPTSSYGGSGQFDITIQDSGNTISGTMNGNINCRVQQNGNNIEFSVSVTPTSVSSNLKQKIGTDNDVNLNFAGSISGSQISANSNGNMGGQNISFNINLSGTMEGNSFRFSLTSTSDAQINISTQEITLYTN